MDRSSGDMASLGRWLHALDIDFKDADHQAIFLLFVHPEGSIDDDLFGEIADGLAFGAVDDEGVLDLRGLAKAAGEEAGDEGEFADAVGLVEGDHEAVGAKTCTVELLDVFRQVAALFGVIFKIAKVLDGTFESFAVLGTGVGLAL